MTGFIGAEKFREEHRRHHFLQQRWPSETAVVISGMFVTGRLDKNSTHFKGLKLPAIKKKEKENILSLLSKATFPLSCFSAQFAFYMNIS